MPFATCWIDPAEVWKGAGLLARWFRFPPSEIDGLGVDDFLSWCRLAADQIKAKNEAR